MDTLQRLEIEVDGICGTIQSYTNEAKINNTLKHLKEAVKTQNIEKLIYLLHVADKWYEEKINKIRRSNYVRNLEAHEDTRVQIKEFLSEISPVQSTLQHMQVQVPLQVKDSNEDVKKAKKLFISHSSKDKVICSAFVELLETIGIEDEMILYTSLPRHGIPGGMDIFNYLRDHLSDGITVFFMLSDNYYNSIYCLNEMGAAWVAQNNFSTFLLPNLSGEIEGVIDRNKKAYSLQEAIDLINFKNELVNTYSLQISETKWEDAKNKFLNIVNGL